MTLGKFMKFLALCGYPANGNGGGGGIGLASVGGLPVTSGPVSLSGTTTATVMASTTLPASSISIGAILEMRVVGLSSASGSTFIFRVTDGTNVLNVSGSSLGGLTAANLQIAGGVVVVTGANSQVTGGNSSQFSSATVLFTGTLNNELPWTVEVIGTPASGATLTLYGASLMITQP